MFSFDYTKSARGLHFQIVTVKTATCAPVIVATRLRKAAPTPTSERGAASLLGKALKPVRAMGHHHPDHCTGGLRALLPAAKPGRYPTKIDQQKRRCLSVRFELTLNQVQGAQ
ncbi:hypothetical protein J3S85_31015 [Streptomyces lavenduligriseus]|nr:hypothetical protein J3S85_31015 [Streptomyces lavenduligriseus]